MIMKAASLRFAFIVFAFAFCFINVVGSQTSPFPVADQVAGKVIAHYEQSSCQELWKEKMQGPPAQKEQMIQTAVEAMRNNPAMRKYFIDKVASTIVNKQFECGMIP